MASFDSYSRLHLVGRGLVVVVVETPVCEVAELAVYSRILRTIWRLAVSNIRWREKYESYSGKWKENCFTKTVETKTASPYAK